MVLEETRVCHTFPFPKRQRDPRGHSEDEITSSGVQWVFSKRAICELFGT